MSANSSTKSRAEWLSFAERGLTAAGIESGRLDALLLMEFVLGIDRALLLAHDDENLSGPNTTKLNDLLARRLTHEPIAYIICSSEFYGRRFFVDSNTLVPRPESESMIDLLLQTAPPGQSSYIADIGTGSGSLAITAKLELPNSRVIATDIDDNCLAIARRNATALGADITFLQGNLLDPIFHLPPSAFQPPILIANLPYVPKDYPVNQAAAHEPATALFSGDDGLDHYRQLCVQLEQTPTKAVIIESLLEQHQPLRDLFKSIGYSLVASDGLAQLFTAP